jgi:NAD(P)-dependent dehydrogenase (short-subunit alcohol dehydrogenase family)
VEGNKSVLITGAGTGFGLVTALTLAEHGYRVYGSVVDSAQRDSLVRAAAARGVSIRVLELDVTDRESIERVVSTIASECSGIWAVVNNAGLGLRGFFEDLSEEEIRRTFEVNVFGAFAVTRAALPHMRRAREGRILFMSSAGGRIAATTLSGYCAGKFAIEGFAESLACEMAPFGVMVSLIEPGLVMTPHFTVHRGRAKAAMDPASPYAVWFQRHERMVDDILKAQRITPEDVAKAIHRALSARRPKLRYVVGWRPKLLIALRRRLPEEWFDRLYVRSTARLLNRPDRSTALADVPRGSESGERTSHA